MTHYRGTGEGEWLAGAYRYEPSVGDRLLAQSIAVGVAERVTRSRRRRTGYGAELEAKPEWYATGFLGEVAALHPLASGPDLEAWRGSHWYGRGDFGPLEVRTTSSWQLYGFAAHAAHEHRERKRAHRHTWHTISSTDDGRRLEACSVAGCIDTRAIGRTGRPERRRVEGEPEEPSSSAIQGAGLGGWRVTAKDRGRIIVAVEDRGDDYLVLGWARADAIPLLDEPAGAIIAVVDYLDLEPLDSLAPYAAALGA